MIVDLARLEQFYRETLELHHNGELQTDPDELHRGAVTTRYSNGVYVYTDLGYVVGDSFSGMIVLHYLNEVKPVWSLHYDGWCSGMDQDVLDFRLRARKSADQVFDGFNGGFGPERYVERFKQPEDLLYQNLGDAGASNFAQFSGCEHVAERAYVEQSIYWMRYFGRVLISDFHFGR